MGWTTPVDRSTGYVVTATDWNATGQDDLTYLYGDTGWTNVSGFSGTWVSLGSPNVARYRLVGSLVQMTGMVGSGTINTAAFTLPAAYRPTQSVQVATTANSAFGQLIITSAGVVTPTTGATSNFSIHCTFSTL